MPKSAVAISLSMEQELAKDTEVGGHGLSSLTLDCYSCKCLRRADRRAFPIGCIRVSRGPYRRRERRPHVLFWRPWTPNISRQESTQSLPYATGLCENHQAGQKPAEYNHPVRLFWPKSKPLDHMYVEAADLLRNFPVQATISFYNDSESDTDNDENNSEEEHDSGFESE